MIAKAREIQRVAERFLYEDRTLPYTDAEEWAQMQTFLAKELEELTRKEGNTPEEEGEMVLAILMGYTVAVRKSRHIDIALQRAERVLPLITDTRLKCELAVFCYGECPDEELAMMAHEGITELKRTHPTVHLTALEELLLDMEG